MRNIFLAVLSVFCLTASAQSIEIKVWPNGAPNDNGITTPEVASSTSISNTSEATLTVYPAKGPNGLAVVACPGGGYTHLAIAHEGRDMADWFNAQGITYAVLKYRMPNGHSDVPVSDALQAIRIMREHAQEWGISKVGIMGSSAGGHLASTAATHFTEDSRPDFQILFYPVITMDPSYTHKGSMDNLCGKNASAELLELYSNEKQVTPNTPQAFIMHCSDDNVVPVANSVNYYLALVANKVPASLHIWPTNGHGWGFRDSNPWKRQWTGELEKWLRTIQ